MTQPPPYKPSYSFTDFSSGSPSSQPPGVDMDFEFNAIALTTQRILDNLRLIQRDDLRLASGSVGIDQLGATSLALIASGAFRVTGGWTTGHAYTVGDIASLNGIIYLTVAAHTSGSLASDVAAGRLVSMFDPTNATLSALLSSVGGAALLGTTQGVTVQVSLDNKQVANCFSSLTAFKAALSLVGTAFLSVAGMPGLFTFTAGDFTGRADDFNIIKANGTAITVGAWVRQGADTISAPNGTVASRLSSLPLYAKDHGVVGDGVINDTIAAQAFIALCGSLAATANFGSLVVRITGPLVANSVNIVFDTASYGGIGAPGFYATGSGYTALTVTSFISDLSVAVYGGGGVTRDGGGNVTADTRSAINGIAFGTLANPLALSVVRSARVYNLAGEGMAFTQSWDTTFMALSVEICGTGTSYAFIIKANVGAFSDTCNECTFVRIQIEQSVTLAIYIHPLTLSCTFVKSHCERASAVAGKVTFVFGGSCQFTSLRVSALNPTVASMLLTGGPMQIDLLRVEGGIVTSVDASGTTIELCNPAGTLRPSANQNGSINIRGGLFAIQALGAGWLFDGCAITDLEVANMPSGQFSVARDCQVFSLRGSSSSTGGNFSLHRTDVGGVSNLGSFAQLQILDKSTVSLASGAQTASFMKLRLDESSRIIGNLTAQQCGFHYAGTIQGNFTIGANNGVLIADTAELTGTPTNMGPPNDGTYLDGFTASMRCKNLAAANGGIPGWQYTTGGAWKAQAALAA